MMDTTASDLLEKTIPQNSTTETKSKIYENIFSETWEFQTSVEWDLLGVDICFRHGRT